jgi:hypothetical protein
MFLQFLFAADMNFLCAYGDGWLPWLACVGQLCAELVSVATCLTTTTFLHTTLILSFDAPPSQAKATYSGFCWVVCQSYFRSTSGGSSLSSHSFRSSIYILESIPATQMQCPLYNKRLIHEGLEFSIRNDAFKR